MVIMNLRNTPFVWTALLIVFATVSTDSVEGQYARPTFDDDDDFGYVPPAAPSAKPGTVTVQLPALAPQPQDEQARPVDIQSPAGVVVPIASVHPTEFSTAALKPTSPPTSTIRSQRRRKKKKPQVDVATLLLDHDGLTERVPLITIDQQVVQPRDDVNPVILSPDDNTGLSQTYQVPTSPAIPARKPTISATPIAVVPSTSAKIFPDKLNIVSDAPPGVGPTIPEKPLSGLNTSDVKIGLTHAELIAAEPLDLSPVPPPLHPSTVPVELSTTTPGAATLSVKDEFGGPTTATRIEPFSVSQLEPVPPSRVKPVTVISMLSGTKQLIPKVSQGMSVVRAHNGPTNLTAFPIVSAPFPALETPIVTVYNANPIPPVAAVPVVGQNMVPQRNAEVTSHIESQSSPIAPEVSTPSTAPDLPSKPIQLSAISSGTTVSPVSLKQLIPTDSARPVSAPALKIDIQHPVGTSAASPPPLRSPAVTPSPNGNSFSFMRLGGYGFDTGDIPETYQLAPAKEMLPELVPAGVRVRTKSGIITSVRGKPGLYGIHPTPPPDPTHAKLRPVQPPEIVYLNQPPKTVPSQPGHAISEAPVPRVQTAVPVAPVNPLIVQQIPVPVLAIQPPKAFKVSRLVPASQSAVNLTTKLAYQEPVRPLLPGRQATVSSIHDTSSANESQRVSPIQTFGASPAKHLIAGLKFALNYQQANDAKLPSLRPHANISLDSSLPLQQVSTGDDVPLTPITISALRSGSAEQVTGPDSNVKLVTPATPQVSTSPLTRKDIGPKPSYVSSIREPDQETKTPIHVIQSPVLTQVSRPAPIEEFFGRPRSNPKYQQIAISPTSGTTISSARPVSSLRFPQSQSTLNTMPGLQSPPSIQVSRPTQLYQVPKITEPKPTLPLPGQIVSGIPINVIPSGRTVQPSRRRRPAYKPLVQSSITLSEKNPKLKTVAAVDSVSPPNPQITSSAYRQASTRLQMPTVSSVKPIRTGYVAPVPQVIQTVPHTTISISNRPTPDVPLSTPRFGQRIRPFTYAAAGPVSPATTVNAEAPLQGPVDAGRKPTQPNSISRQVADRVPIVSVINELPSSQRASQRSTFQASAQRRPLNSAAISPKTIVTSFETPQFATAVPSSITTHDKPFTVDSTLPTLTVPPLQSVHEPLTLLYETLGPNQNVNSHIDVQPVITIQLSRPKERFRVPSKTAYTTNNTSTSQLEPEKNLFSPIGPDSPDRYNGLKPRSDIRPAIIAPLSHPIQRISIPLKPAHKASRVLLEAGSPSSGRLPTPIEAVGPGRINAFTPLLNIQSADSVPLNPQIERDSVPATFTYNAPHTLQQPARPISRLPYTETSELTSTRYTDSNSRELLEPQTPRDSQAVHISGQNKPISPLVSHLTSKNIQSSKPVALTSSVERTSPTNGNSFSFMRIGGYGFDHGEIPKAYQIAPAKEMLPELVPAGVRVRTKSGVISSVRGTPGLYGIHPTPPPDPTHHKKPAPAPQIVYLKETQEGPSSTSRPFLQTTHRGAPAPTAPTGVARTITAQNLTVRRPPIPTSMGQTRIPLFLSTSQPANQQTDTPTFSFGVQANTIQGYPVPSSLDLSPQIKVTLASPQPQVVPQQSPNTIPPSPHQTISALRQTANLHKASSRPQIVPLRASSPTSAPALPHIVPVSGAPHKPLAGPSNVFSPTISLNTPGGSGSYGNDLSDFEDFETPTTQAVPIDKIAQVASSSRSIRSIATSDPATDFRRKVEMTYP